MPRPYFVADQATVTVLKPVASSAFGSYKLSVPEDVDISDIYQFAAPGNELGYVASLAPKGVRVGGFARRFVRADVSVTAADVTDPDWVPASDVDKVLTEAAARVEGDFFLESDISRAGLGPWVPFTHFEQGDLATVEIWGRRVPLPVTRIEPKVTDHDENDWSVHVGGQVLTDDEARLAENETLRQAAVQSRREVAGLESQTAKAVSTADSANAKSDRALKAATDADGTIQSKLDEHRRLVAEFDADVVVNEQAADEMSRAAESYAASVAAAKADTDRYASLVASAKADTELYKSLADAAKADTDRYESLVAAAKADTELYKSLADAAKADTERYASLVAEGKSTQSAMESAAADAKQASDDVSTLVNAPDGEFRKGVAKFTEFQTMVNDKQSAWNVGIQKTLDAQSDVNAKQQQINAVQDDVNAKQQQINAVQDDVNAKQQQINAVQDDVNAKQQQINDVQSDVNTKQQQINDVQSDVNAKQKQVNESQRQINATQSNINRQQGEINTALSKATKAASNAATDAKTAADAATKTAADAVSTANLVKEQQAAYEALSEERNALQDSNIEMLADLQKEQLRALGDVFLIGGDRTVYTATVSNAYFSKSSSSDYLTALGSWSGRIIFTSYGRSATTGTKETGMYEVPVPLPDGSRRINLKNYTPAATTIDTDWIQVQYWVDPAVQYRSEKTGSSFTATQNAWATIGTHTISRSKKQDNFVGSWRVFWGAANRGSTYGIRIVTSSGTVLKQRTTTELGPLSILGNGRWSMYMQVSGVDIPAGQDVYFQVYCSHSGTSQRGIYKSESSASWLEEN